MEWDAISGVSGAISAIVAIISLIGLNTENKTLGRLPLTTVSAYILFSSGWVLSVIAFNWCFEPFGPYLTNRSEKNLYGVMLSAPALILTLYAFSRMHDKEAEPQGDKKESTDILNKK